MIVTFYKEWVNEFGHKFKAGETVELWDARHALRSGVCVKEGYPIPVEDIEQVTKEVPEKITKSKKGKK